MEGMIGQPTFINPVNAANDVDRDIIPLLFSNLLQLTDSYQVSADNKVWTIVLKKGLAWDDGQKLTADDIVYSINAIQDPNTHSPLYNDWRSVAVERLNENEIRFTLPAPYTFFLDNLRTLRPIPKHIFADIPITNFRLSNYNLEPVGSGPYRYANLEKEKNGFITSYFLEPNERFFGERPYIKSFVFKFFNNTDDLISAFNKNQISSVGGLDHQAHKNIKRDSQYFQISIPRYYAVFFNLSSQDVFIKNKDFRLALTLATDKEKIIDSALQKNAIVINGPIFPGLEGYDKELYKEIGFNGERAQKIFIDKKFADQKITLDLVVPEISFLVDAANIIRENWQKLGIKVNLIFADPATVANQYVKTRNYSAILFGNILKSNSDVTAFWHSSQRFYPGLNLSLYNSNDADVLLDVIKQEADPVRRQKSLLSLQQRILKDLPAVFLFSPNYTYITTKNLKGVEMDFLTSASDRFNKVNKWYLKTSRRFK